VRITNTNNKPNKQYTNSGDRKLRINPESSVFIFSLHKPNIAKKKYYSYDLKSVLTNV